MKTLIFILMVCFTTSCQTAPGNFDGAIGEQSAAVMAIRDVKENQQEQPSTDRKLIKTGYLNISVADAGKAKTEIEKICKEYNAYIFSETRTSQDEMLQYEQVIRVPEGSFDVIVKKIEGLSSEVKAKNIQTSDVTGEFIDNEARIKTKKELENRYREILKDAKVVSDILSIEAQLNQVRADIESMEGRLNYLRNQVAFSTLTLSFYEPIGAEFGFGSKTVAAIGNGWDMLLVFIIGILHFWPFLIIIALIVFFIIRKTRVAETSDPAGQTLE